MIDLSQWRASIGGWNSRCTSYCCPSSPNKTMISAVGDCLGSLAVLCGCQVMMSLLSVVLGLRLILMLSGDIELNPGPDCCALHISSLPIITIVSLLLILAGDVETNPGPVTVGELVDSLKDLVDWETFAIHLPEISSSDIEKIVRNHTGSIDRQKFYLFQLWLNHCPNPSWDDVVQALHKNENHAMAVKVKEEKVIQGHKLQSMECSSKSAYPLPLLQPELNDVFFLLKPHSVAWKNIGRALNVPRNFFDWIFTAIPFIPKDDNTNLKNVINKWIESQCSEVSWDHLIEVLQDDDLMMATTVSKIKEYLLNTDEAKEKYQWKDKSGHKLQPTPVPMECSSNSWQPPESDDVFFLLKSHSADWQDFGRALGVNKKHRDEGVMAKSNDSKLKDVLNQWIESQCSEVSWDNLIEVLQDELMMADTVSKIKEYLLNNDEAKEKYQWKDKSESTKNDDQLCPIIPSLPPYLTRYSGLLKQKYKDQPVISSEWPPRVGKDYYGRLLLLDKERRDDKTEQNKIWNTMRGKIDILPEVTKLRVVNIPDVLKPDSSAIVLIDGPPGVGKTTFCRKLINMWANVQLPTDQQQRYTVVLYCSLRDKRIAEANTLTDIMKTCLNDNSIEEVDKYIAEHSGDGLLIIFDGWDELSMEHRESSLAVRFIRREILIKCTVIVTSRSYASESIMSLNGNYRHFEVIGFEKCEVHEVIEETLHDDDQLASDLIKELESQTNIESLCYIPLVCSMVILVYKKSKHLPSRLTELYEEFILHAVKRHVQKSLTISTDPKRIRSLNKLPSCIEPSFNELCHFAYLSLKENNPRMTFSLPELEDALDVSVTEGYIGLMTTVSVYDEELYQFPHLTIQEFLAAWWIANNDGMDVKAFEEHFEDDHFRMCLRFVAGLTGLKNEKFKEMKYFNIKLDLRCARDYQTNSFFKDCYQLISTDIPQRQLHLLHESNNADLCNHMANTCIDNSFCFLGFCEFPDSFDVICMLFFLHLSGKTWNKIHICIDSIGSPLPGLIMADTSTNVIKCKDLIIKCENVIRPTYDFNEPGFLDKVLHLFSSDNVYCKCNSCNCLDETLIALLKKPQIKKIHVPSQKQDESFINVESFPLIKKLLKTTKTLEELKVNISGFTEKVSRDLTVLIIDGVMRNKSIKSLKIHSSSLSDDKEPEFDYSDVSRNFEQLLKDNTTLEEIDMDPPPYDISEINAPLRSVKYSWLKPTEIESVLARCQHLQSLTIDDRKFPQPLRISITNLFNHHLPELSKLNVLSLGNSDLWVELFTILQTNQTLKELSIYAEKASVMSDEVLLSLKNYLIHNKSIKHLDIHFTDSINFLLTMTEGLSNNKTIELLKCWIDTTTNEGRSLLNTVFKMESLISLELTLRLKCECIDGVDLYPMITSLLHQNTHIKEFHISIYLESSIDGKLKYIDMTHSESWTRLEELIETIYNHPTLEYVYLELCIQHELQSRLKRITEQCLYKKQISNCVSPHTKIPPLIELHL